MREKQSHAEGDAWAIAFPDAERRLLRGAGRARCLALLKTLRDRNLVADSPNSSQSVLLLLDTTELYCTALY